MCVAKKVWFALLMNFENGPILMVYCYSVTNQSFTSESNHNLDGLIQPESGVRGVPSSELRH